ncbi:MAG: hypothetical protein ACOC56_06725, partial [Atribacterota bacterium]
MKKDNKFIKKTSKVFQKSILQRLFIFFLIVLSITSILSINFIPGKILLKEGEVAPRDIVAPETIEFIDEGATEKLKEQAARNIREVYNLNLASIENIEEELDNFFSDVADLREKTDFPSYSPDPSIE